jgi:hypothetical protein
MAYCKKKIEVCDQRHTLKDRRPSTTACPTCWTMGTKELKYCMVKKEYFVLDQLEQSRQINDLLYQDDMPNEPTKEGPFHLYSLSPHSPQFQETAGATPL